MASFEEARRLRVEAAGEHQCPKCGCTNDKFSSFGALNSSFDIRCKICGTHYNLPFVHPETASA